MLIKTLTLRFSDPALESSYLSARLPQAIRHNRIASAVGAVTVLCFMLAGWLTRDDLLQAVLPYRLASLALFLGLIVMCQVTRMRAFHDLMISLSAFGLWLLLWPLCLTKYPPDIVRFYNLPSTMLYVAAVFSLIDLRLPYRVGLALVITPLAVALMIIFRTTGATSYLAFDLAHYVSMVLIGTTGAWLMERYRRQDFIHAREARDERAKSERLLLNILPEPIARQLKDEHKALADGFEEVTVLFSDIVGFTPLSERLPPETVVRLLNRIFSEFDNLAEKFGVEKIKTIGDAYMVAAGLPERSDDHAETIARMALEMQALTSSFAAEIGEALQLRIGINTGPVVAGVIGRKKFIYDLWGDTVNTASRMESHGVPGKIQVTEAVYRRLKGHFDFALRGEIEIKGKGLMPVYYLLGEAVASRA
jgi:class 3 adenylate cyclase